MKLTAAAAFALAGMLGADLIMLKSETGQAGHSARMMLLDLNTGEIVLPECLSKAAV